VKVVSLGEAQEQLPELVRQAQKGLIGLTDDSGQLVGLLAGVTDDNLDDLLANTPGFQAMIAASSASLQSEEPVSADELLAEARARMRKGPR
jgi:hypothetical protein